MSMSPVSKSAYNLNKNSSLIDTIKDVKNKTKNPIKNIKVIGI